MNRILVLVVLAACIPLGVSVAGAETPDPLPDPPSVPVQSVPIPTPTVVPLPTIQTTPVPAAPDRVAPTRTVPDAGAPTVVTPQTIAPAVVTPGTPSVQTLYPTTDPTLPSTTSLESIAGELATTTVSETPEPTTVLPTTTIETATSTTTPTTTETSTTEATTTTTATTTAAAGGLTIDSGEFVGSTDGTDSDTVRGTMSVEVSDTRDGGDGWIATVTVSDFVGSRTGITAPGSGRYTAPSTACSESTGPQQLSSARTPVQVAETDCDARWTARIELDVPRDGEVADDYTATIVHSVA